MNDNGSDMFQGARFTGADFSRATFRDCDVTGLKIVNSYLADVNVSGFLGNVGSLPAMSRLQLFGTTQTLACTRSGSTSAERR